VIDDPYKNHLTIFKPTVKSTQCAQRVKIPAHRLKLPGNALLFYTGFIPGPLTPRAKSDLIRNEHGRDRVNPKATENIPKRMKSKGGRKRMDVSFWVLCVVTGVLVFIGYRMKGWDLPLSGLVRGGGMLLDIGPNLLLGFALAGIVQVLIPNEYIARMLGEGSGLKGILIATVAGALAPGGPYVNIPLVASFYTSGASIGPLAAFLTAWGLIPINRTLVYEIPLLGSHFALARYVSSIVFPFVIGVITSFIFRLMK
jgi:uncharacterized protein